VQDIRLKIQICKHLQHCAGKERESLRVVIVTVQPRAFEIILIIEQIIYNSVMARFKNAAILPSPCNRNGQAGNEIHLLPEFLRDILIQRKNNPAAYKTRAHCAG
jgi:hypothetical protein